MPVWIWRPLFRFWLSVVRADPDRGRAVKELLVTYDDAYRALDLAAIDYDEGVHPKHRLTRYHDFFVERVNPGETVLDIGTGKGELAHDLVARGGASVVVVDHDPSHLAYARANFVDERLEFRDGDVIEGIPPGHFDVVVLSNVLEHLGPRVEFLARVVESATPRCVLLRVPLYERDWTVPLKAEVGLSPY
jgi:2-polyprenyl-3-methyl-5-hydroxy-6-metoxy-1,4-benzoquinol methylase